MNSALRKSILVTLLFITPMVATSAIPSVRIDSPLNDDLWLGEKTIKVSVKNIEMHRVGSVEIFLDGQILQEFKSPPFRLTHNFGQVPKNRVLQVLLKDRYGIVIAQHEIRSYHLDDTREVDVAQVVVPVVVTDSNGYYVQDLDREDFIVMEDGVSQPVTYFDRKGKTKFHLILLIDISSSMKDKIGDVKDAAKIFLEELMDKKDRAMVVLFNHEVFEDTEFTDDVHELFNSISIAFPFGATALYDAIAYCSKLVRGIPGRNIIIVFSDGEDNSSYIDPFTLMKRVERSNSVVYSIGKKTLSVDDVQYRDLLRKISESSGGVSFFFDEVEEIQAVYRQIRRDIRAKYILQFEPPKRGSVKRFRQITVRVKGQKRYSIRTIKGYYY